MDTRPSLWNNFTSYFGTPFKQIANDFTNPSSFGTKVRDISNLLGGNFDAFQPQEKPRNKLEINDEHLNPPDEKGIRTFNDVGRTMLQGTLGGEPQLQAVNPISAYIPQMVTPNQQTDTTQPVQNNLTPETALKIFDLL